MGVGDGARAVPRGADPWPREQKSVAGVRVGYAPASPEIAHVGVVPQGLHDTKVLLIVIYARRSLMRPG